MRLSLPPCLARPGSGASTSQPYSSRRAQADCLASARSCSWSCIACACSLPCELELCMRCNPTPPDKLCDRPHMRPQQSQGFARALTNARAWLCRQACAVPRAAARRRCRGWPRCACWARRRPRAWPRAWRPWTSRACAAARAVTPLRRCWLAGRWRWRRRAARERGAQPSLVHRRAALAAPSAQRYALGRYGRSGRVAARAAAARACSAAAPAPSSACPAHALSVQAEAIGDNNAHPRFQPCATRKGQRHGPPARRSAAAHTRCT